MTDEPLTCRNDGCTEDARTRSSYCSPECYEEDTGTTPAEILDPDGGGV